MAVPTSITDLSTTASSNSPAGSDSIGTSLDDFLRGIQAILKQQFVAGTTLASGTTITPLADGNYITVSGTTTITTIASTNSWNGRIIVLKFSGALQLTHSATLIMPLAANYTTTANDVLAFVQESAGTWRCIFGQAFLVYLSGNNTWTGTQTFRDNKFEITDDSDTTKKLALQLSGITTGTTRTLTIPDRNGIPMLDVDAQSQVYQYFTTAGSDTAYTLTPTPATTANAAGQRFRVVFNAASGTTPTLAVSGQSALNLKYRDASGAKQAVTSTQIPANWVSDVECDGTDWVVLDIPTSTTWVSGSTIATTSGTSIDLATGLPSNVKAVTISFSQLSVDSSSPPIIQLGDSGGLETTGYLSTASVIAATVATAAYTTGFGISYTATAAYVWSGTVTLIKEDDTANKWVMSGVLTGYASNTACYICAGEKELTGALTQITLTTVSGAPAFDGGSVRVRYEV
jgi:hypothetical protein